MSSPTVCASEDVTKNDENSRNKLTRTLSRLLEESFFISDDTVLEKLFTHVTKQVETEGKTRTTLQVYVLWLSLVERKWSTLHTRVRIFALKVAGLVCSSPAGFFLIQEKNIVQNVIYQLKNEKEDSAVILAVITLLTELVKHQAGCNWILQTEVWRRVVHIYNINQSIYVARAGSKFITLLVLAFETFDKMACRKVIEAVLMPLNIEKTTKPLPTKMEILRSLQLYVNPDGVPIVYKEMLPKEDGVPTQSDGQVVRKKPISKGMFQRDAINSIRLLCDILEGMLMSDMNTARVNEVLMEYSLEMWAWEQVHNENKDTELLKWLSMLLNFLNYLGTDKTQAGEIKYRDLETLSISILRLTQTLLYKKQFIVVFEVCIHCQTLRHKIIKGIIYPDEKTKSHSFDLENQLVVLQLIPVFTFLKRISNPHMMHHESEIMSNFVEKLLSVTKHDTIRVCYEMSDLLRDCSDEEVACLAIRCIHCLMQTIEFVRRLMPVSYFVRRKCYPGGYILENAGDEILYMFAEKMWALCKQDTLRVCYEMFDLLRCASDAEVEYLAKHSIHYLVITLEFVLRLMPVFYFIRRKCYPGGYNPDVYDDDIVHMFLQKLFAVCKQDTFRVCHEMYDLLRSASDAEVEYLAKHSIHYLVKTLELVLRLMPVSYFIRRKCYPGGYTPDLYEDDILYMFAEKIWAICKQDTFRVCYETYDLLRSASDAEVEYLAKHSIHYLVKTLEFVLRLMPIFYFIRRNCYPNGFILESIDDDILHMFVGKVWAVCKQDTLRVSYEMLDLLRSASDADVEYLAKHSIHYLERTLELVLRSMPIFYFTRRKCYPHGFIPENIDDEILYIFVQKVMTVSKQDTLRVCYEMHDLLRSASDAHVEYLARYSIHYLEETLELVLRSLPLFVFMKVTAVHSSDVVDKYAEKLFAVSHNETLRAWYQFRDIIRLIPNFNLVRLAEQTVVSLITCLDYINREQAVIIFQTMMHTLKEFVPHECSEITDNCVVANPNSQSLVQQCPVMLMHILKCISTLIEKFRITWRECLETVCLLSFVQSLLENPNISTGLCIQSLKLVKQTIENFIPPNLALLVNTLKGSSIEILGPLLLEKLHDTSWEVRDSCLEVLQVIASLSEIKFPAFQNLILEPELLETIVSMITTDQESYVRATAMTCLSELVKVQELWENKLRNKQLIPVLMDVLSIETEGIVRREACSLVTSIYKRQGVPECKMVRLYETMFHAAVTDLHWEVKVYALTFWKEVIFYHLVNQGMIDGLFPSVTFSKQLRKIVTLDSAEIHTRLSKVMHELGKNGCLQVLWQCIHDDCDVAVMRKAVDMTRELVDLLAQYSLTEKELSAPLPLTSSSSSSSRDTSSISKDTYLPPGCEDICGDICKKMRCEPSSLDNSVPSTSSQANSPTELASSSSSKPCSQTSPRISEEEKQHMEDVIDTILNDSDVDLLSPGYRHNVNFKISGGGDKKCKKLMPKEFLQKIKTVDLIGMLNSRTQWLEDTSDNLDSLLDDILAVKIKDTGSETNVVDCY